jgi:hypothetical protein
MRSFSLYGRLIRTRAHALALVMTVGVILTPAAEAFPELARSTGLTSSNTPARTALPVGGMGADTVETSISMRAWVLVEARPEEFFVEVVLQISNPNKQRHLPVGVGFTLPNGHRSFQTESTPSGLRLRLNGSEVQLEGPVTRGVQQASFAFAIPTGGEEQFSFRMTMPPGTAEVQVGWVGPHGSDINVEGFSQAIPGHLPNGMKLLVVRRDFDGSLVDRPVIACNINGLPTKGPARTIAALIAIVLVVGGLAGGLRLSLRRHGKAAARGREELVAGRALLIEELVFVERAWNDKVIGQETYETTRRELLQAAVRVEHVLTNQH